MASRLKSKMRSKIERKLKALLRQTLTLSRSRRKALAGLGAAAASLAGVILFFLNATPVTGLIPSPPQVPGITVFDGQYNSLYPNGAPAYQNFSNAFAQAYRNAWNQNWTQPNIDLITSANSSANSNYSIAQVAEAIDGFSKGQALQDLMVQAALQSAANDLQLDTLSANPEWQIVNQSRNISFNGFDPITGKIQSISAPVPLLAVEAAPGTLGNDVAWYNSWASLPNSPLPGQVAIDLVTQAASSGQYGKLGACGTLGYCTPNLFEASGPATQGIVMDGLSFMNEVNPDSGATVSHIVPHEMGHAQYQLDTAGGIESPWQARFYSQDPTQPIYGNGTYMVADEVNQQLSDVSDALAGKIALGPDLQSSVNFATFKMEVGSNGIGLMGEMVSAFRSPSSNLSRFWDNANGSWLIWTEAPSATANGGNVVYVLPMVSWKDQNTPPDSQAIQNKIDTVEGTYNASRNFYAQNAQNLLDTGAWTPDQAAKGLLGIGNPSTAPAVSSNPNAQAIAGSQTNSILGGKQLATDFGPPSTGSTNSTATSASAAADTEAAIALANRSVTPETVDTTPARVETALNSQGKLPFDPAPSPAEISIEQPQPNMTPDQIAGSLGGKIAGGAMLAAGVGTAAVQVINNVANSQTAYNACAGGAACQSQVLNNAATSFNITVGGVAVGFVLAPVVVQLATGATVMGLRVLGADAALASSMAGPIVTVGGVILLTYGVVDIMTNPQTQQNLNSLFSDIGNNCVSGCASFSQMVGLILKTDLQRYLGVMYHSPNLVSLANALFGLDLLLKGVDLGNPDQTDANAAALASRSQRDINRKLGDSSAGRDCTKVACISQGPSGNSPPSKNATCTSGASCQAQGQAFNDGTAGEQAQKGNNPTQAAASQQQAANDMAGSPSGTKPPQGVISTSVTTGALGGGASDPAAVTAGAVATNVGSPGLAPPTSPTQFVVVGATGNPSSAGSTLTYSNGNIVDGSTTVASGSSITVEVTTADGNPIPTTATTYLVSPFSVKSIIENSVSVQITTWPDGKTYEGWTGMTARDPITGWVIRDDGQKFQPVLSTTQPSQSVVTNADGTVAAVVPVPGKPYTGSAPSNGSESTPPDGLLANNGTNPTGASGTGGVPTSMVAPVYGTP